MKKIAKFGAVVFTSMAMLLASAAQANVVITGTRIIYKSDDREVTIKMDNVGHDPALVQVWADRGNEKSEPTTADAPFLIMPPIFRVDTAKAQTVRLTFTGDSVPPDRESVYWLNILDVPPLPKASNEQHNYVQVAFRSRLKLFYRPAGLPGNPDDAADKLSWQLVALGGNLGYALRASNASAFHVSLNFSAIQLGGHEYRSEGGMIAPGGSTDFKLKGLTARPAGQAVLLYESINDFGAPVAHSLPLNP